MSTRPLTGIDHYQVEAARRLLADLTSIDWASVTEYDLAFLVGRTTVVLASLTETAEEDER
jgi:hypothetical protein